MRLPHGLSSLALHGSGTGPSIFPETPSAPKAPLSYAIARTALGWVGLLASPRGLRRLTLPVPTPEQARFLLGDLKDAVEDASVFEGLLARLKDYLAGRQVSFEDRIDPEGTPFQHDVWRSAQSIPCGETRSYSWLACQLGKPGAARAVGQALGKNPVAIVVPCHRVVSSNGGLGGFGYGLERKEFLLQLEARQTHKSEILISKF